jgi:hypothetical protein
MGSKSAIVHGKFGRKKNTWKTIFKRKPTKREIKKDYDTKFEK